MIALAQLAIAGFAVAAVAGVLGRAVPAALRASLMLCAAASGVVLVLGGALVIGGEPVTFSAGTVLTLPVMDVRFDALSGAFLAALGVLGIAASVEALDTVTPADSTALTAAAYPLFLLSLLLVFGAASGFSFLLAWETMALTSAALVIGARPTGEHLRAGFLYLAATHLATAGLLIGFAGLAAAAGGDFGFAAWARVAGELDPLLRDGLFVLFVVGFGTKAGVIPLHVWLPRAHPAAPSHVSALMSGVMIKTGVYGLIRVGGEILGPGPEWWGLLLIGLGAVTAVLGVLYALMEQHLKRLLAFSSIENVGILFLALGASFVLRSHGNEVGATVALVAVLLHSFNHALFKGLLFLGAGAIQHATGTLNLNRLGGLVRTMPGVALGFGVGAAALAGLPPLNGFAGEWQTFQALIAMVGSGGAVGGSVAALAIGALGLAAALALAAGVKVTGVTFLALPRSTAAASSHEAGGATRAALGILAAGCVAAGLGAGALASVLSPIARASLGPAPATNGLLMDPILPALIGAEIAGAYAPLPLGIILLVGAAGVALLAGLVAGRRARVVGDTWTCGIAPDPAYEYTATSFAKPLRLFFRRLLRPTREVAIELHHGTTLPRSIAYSSAVAHVVDRDLYRRSQDLAIRGAQVVRRLQNGSLQLYLAYALGAIVLLLVFAR